jgi:hypothetical protein
MLHNHVGNWGMPAERENELARAVRTAVPGLMDGVSVTLKVVENKAGQLTAEVYRDARVSEHSLTLPVTLPPAASAGIKTRIAGCIYLTGEGDVPLVQALSAIFPGLNAWSTVPINLGLGRVSGRPVHSKVVPLGDPAYARHLASTTLALDLEGLDPDLPRRSASLCVPCLSRDFLPEQRFLWPRLSLPGSELAMALDLAAPCSPIRVKLPRLRSGSRAPVVNTFRKQEVYVCQMYLVQQNLEDDSRARRPGWLYCPAGQV